MAIHRRPVPNALHRSIRQRYLLLSLLAMAIISVLAYGLFAMARRELIAHEWTRLESFADERLTAINAWITDRRQEAQRFTLNPYNRAAAERLLTTGNTGADWPYFQADFQVLLHRPQYEAIAFVDARGRMLRTYGSSPALAGNNQPPLRTGSITIIDLITATGTTRIMMNLPFWERGRYLGSMLFVINPYKEAGRYLTPSSNESASVSLFREAGEHALVVLDSSNAPKGSRLVPADPGYLLTQAALSGSGRVTGRDRAGEWSIGAVRAVPGTPWFLVAQMHWNDAYAPARRFAAYTTLLVVGLFAFVGLLGYNRWRRVESSLESELLGSELARERATQRLDYLARYANDAILLLSPTGQITEANERAVEMYGYSREELLRMTIGQLRAPGPRRHLQEDWQQLLARGAFLTETVHLRKGGEEFPIESSWRVISLEHEQVVQAIIRDITDRKRTEDRIRKLSRLYRTLSEVNEATLRQRDESSLLATALEIARNEAKFVSAWTARPVSGHMVVDGYVGAAEADFRASLTPEIGNIEAGRVTLARAYRDGRCAYQNHYRQHATPALQAWVAAHQVGSVASFPIFIGDAVELVFGVYSHEEEGFDNEVIDLLQRMANNIGFAIMAMRQRAALHESEERLSLVLDATGGCYWDLRFDQKIAYFSPPLTALFALPNHPLSLDRAEGAVMRVVAPESHPKLWADFAAHLRGETPDFVSEYQALPAHGPMRWFRARGKVVARDRDGRPLRMTGTNTDIEAERRTGEQLRLWASVFEHSRELIIIADAGGRVVSANAAFGAATGYEATELAGRDTRSLAADPSMAAYENGIRAAAETGYWQGELQTRRKSGELLPVWAMLTSVRGPRGEIANFIWIASDLSEQRAAKERIQRLFYYDSLTGLPNRNLFRDRLNEAIINARTHRLPLAVMVVDMDNFKAVNDTFGYAQGDRLLRQIGERLTARIGDTGTVARRGDDEFLIFVANLATSESSAEIAQGLVDEIGHPTRLDDTELYVTATIGISIFPTDAEDADALLSNADAALYFAKESGRSHFRFFIEQLNRRARERLRIHGQLRSAIEHGDLVMHYQPQVDWATQRPIGVEALVRWHRGDRLVYPNEFIPIAEETGLIIPLGDWVVQETCRQGREWENNPAMRELVLAFNLSPLQYREKGVMDRVSHYLQSRCDTRRLEMEFTERTIMEDVEESAETLRRLKQSGLRLAIDDFGTGYSSLAYLRRFPIDRLKVDQSFVRDLPHDMAARSITYAIISLAQSLEIDVLAEGVENEQEMQLLHDRGCDYVQGYYFSRPLPPGELEAWWSDRYHA